MNPNDLSERIMAQARDLQNKVTQAASQSAEQMKPLIEQSMTTAGELQKTLAEHAAKTAALNQDYTNRALAHVSELMKLGSEAMRANAEQARAMAQDMVGHARKAYETTSTFGRDAAKDD